MEEKTVTAEPAVSKRKVHPSRFKLAELVVNTHCIVVEGGTPIEAMSEPSYWSHVARMLRPGDEIKVRCDDGAYAATLYVKDVGSQAAVVIPVWHADLNKVEALPAVDEYKVEWAGPHHKHRIIRKSDGVVMQSGFDNKDAAYAAMATLTRAKAA
jgi:hypothetical protein